MGRKTVKILFGIRIVLWMVAAGATAYWIYWSMHLYTLGFENEHEYAKALRPILSKGLMISVAAILVSFLLRSISDKIKKNNRGY
ncbi:MAG: hypothetical protein ACI4FY_08800 [Acetatifactor sp.]